MSENVEDLQGEEAGVPAEDAPEGVPQPAAKDPDETGAGYAQIIAALNAWISGLSGVRDPPFHAGAKFPDSEWTNFFRLLAVSTALAGASAIARNFAPDVFKPSLDGKSFYVITVFTCFGVIYSILSFFFGIRISVRQSLFCFALVCTPWFPFFILLKTAGPALGLDWFILLGGLSLYVFILLVRAIHTVSTAAHWRIVLSLLLGLALAALAVWPVSLGRPGDDAQSSQTSSPSAPATTPTSPAGAASPSRPQPER
jgi:hypothetical protein